MRSTKIKSNVLQDAMRYALLGGGKRIRPVLVYAVGEALGQTLDQLDFAAAAVECIHCYSLIHDDLPAMDDDQLRRGKPTCHIVFGEATAILAGDALLTFAFELLAMHSSIPAETQLRMMRTVAQFSGSSGMVAGQCIDLSSENKILTETELEEMHILKTGGLIRASGMLGALVAGADDKKLNVADQFAMQLGLIFQLQDDLLDAIGNSKTLGKNTLQDFKSNKFTYVTLLGIEETKKRIQSLTQAAKASLINLSKNTAFLSDLCDYLMTRDQ